MTQSNGSDPTDLLSAAASIYVLEKQSPGSMFHVREKGILRHFNYVSMNILNEIYFQI